MSRLSHGTVLAVAFCLAAAPGAHAASLSPSARPSPWLYGQSDPSHDGVWRQSFALLALDTAGVRPPRKAVDWLLARQCPEGGWTPFRGGAEGCPFKLVTQDTNATAAAVQALSALGGHTKQVKEATNWLLEARNEDGGWAYQPDQPSDANSTALVISALSAADQDPNPASRGGTARDALVSFQLGCEAPRAQRGAFAYQPSKKGELVANDSATAAAALALLGKGLPVKAPDKEAKTPRPLDCSSPRGKTDPKTAASAAAAYLVARLENNGHHLNAPGKGAGPDFTATAQAAMALAAGGYPTPARKAVAWLEKESEAWSKGQPAALASLILSARATGGDPTDFAGANLVRRLADLGPDPASTDEGAKERESRENEETARAKEERGGGLGIWYTITLGLLIGIGGGFLVSTRRKRS